MRLDDQLCFSLYAASNLLTRLYQPALRDLGLTYPQYLVLLVLWEQDDQTVGELCERLHLDSGTLTPMLKRMEMAGLLERRRDPRDERRVRIGLTSAGSALREDACSVPASIGGRFSQDPADLLRLRSMLQDLVTELEKM